MMTNPRTHMRRLVISQWVAVVSCAIVFALAILIPNPASAQTYTVIHNFTGGPGGERPLGGVVMDHAGYLYGTTPGGGSGSCNDSDGPNCGTVYQLNPSNGFFKAIWKFAGGTDGAQPEWGLIIGPGDTLYGTTFVGGQPSCGLGGNGCGTVFSLLPPVSPPRSIQEDHWIENILYRFHGDDGNGPAGDLALDGAGNLYDATVFGGNSNFGVVFKLNSSHGTWSISVLHHFSGIDGETPLAGVTLDTAGNIYGTTAGGGSNAFGNVYELVANSDWMANNLYSFAAGSDGFAPESAVTFDSSGNLYGTTAAGGRSGASGTAFELSNGNWSFHLLYSFAGPNHECGPLNSALIFDRAGNLYGTTLCDGTNSWGSVFKLTPSNGIWTYTSLHDFSGGNDGGYPSGNLTFDANGNLYGTASCGGNTGTCGNVNNPGHGVVFKITL